MYFFLCSSVSIVGTEAVVLLKLMGARYSTYLQVLYSGIKMLNKEEPER